MEAILRWRIQALKIEIIDLRKEKVWVYTEMDIVIKSINSSNDRNIEIQKINDSLLLENEKISQNNAKCETEIAVLLEKERDILKNIETKEITIKTLSLSEVSLNNDIVNLNNDRVSLTEDNSKLNKDKLNKKKDLEKLQESIKKDSLILEELSKNIELIKDREFKIKSKDNELLIKNSRLNKKETRLNDLRKFLIAKK